MAEIKISDLSVGDWVRYESTVRTLPMKVLEIGEKDTMCDGQIYITGGTEAGRIFCEVTELKPIPLTPEILEKNGWLPPRKAIELDTWWWTNGVDKAIEAYEYEGEWYLTIIEQKEIQYRNRVGIGLKYVHQLQNALRLAGVEKEIEL